MTHQVTEKVTWRFLGLSTHAVGFFQGVLSDEVPLLIVIGKNVQHTLGSFLRRLSIPDKSQFPCCDDTQRGKT